jgi:hypothetical protein
MALTVADFELPNLEALSSENVQQLLATLSAQLQELNPSLDLRRGVFHDMLAYYHAVLEAAIRTNLERYQSARSLQQIEADPTLADETVVNEVLSNWGVTRKAGTKAKGSVTIELLLNRSVVITQNSVFQANGKVYFATATFTARTSQAQVAVPTDRLLVQLSNGNWAFVIEVEAEDVGPDYILNANSLIVPEKTITNYVTSYATSTFDDGVNTETNAELIDQLQLGLAAKTLSNRTNMRAYLRSIDTFSSITNQSIVGYGDPEMLRDRHTIFPVSYGGRVDWYIRGQQALQRTTKTVSAVCISIYGSTSTWQFSITKNEFPGFYEVSKIRRVVDANLNSGFEILSDTRGNDLTGGGFIPDIATIAEGAYTAFQTTIIQFVDTATNTATLSIGQTSDYICDITGTILIKEVQDLVSSRDVRSYAADALIKAPVPCFTQVTLTINKMTGEADPDTAGIKQSILDVINQTDFYGRLDGSRIINVVHNYLSNNMSTTSLDLFGRIRRPDGSVQYLRSAEALVIPDQPESMVTAKTVQFYSELSDISVNVASTIPVAG